MESAALQKVVGSIAQVYEAIEANSVASDAARFQTSMSELNAVLKSKKSYTIDELESLGVSYPSQYGPDKLPEVPAYLVSQKVYQKSTGLLYKSALSTMSRKGRNVISKMYGQMYKEGMAAITSNAIAEAYSVRSNETEIEFDSAVASGNSNAAEIIAQTAKSTGIWDANKYKSKMSGMSDKVAKGKYLNELVNNNDSVILNVHLDAMLADPALSASSKLSLYKSMSSRIKAIQKEEDDAKKLADDQKSYDAFVDISTEILDSNEPMDWQSINKITSVMRPADGKGLITLNRMMQTKGTVTDPKTHMRLANIVNSISLPRENTTIYQRREAAVDQLMRASGFDPVTGEQVSTSKISPGDFQALMNQINKSQSFVYDNPEIKRVSNQMWITLTGGSRDMMTSFFGTGADTINAVQAEKALLEAARASGPGFDPDAWWSKNGTAFLTSSIDNNEQAMKENRIDRYIVRDSKSAGFIDMDSTVQAINDRVKSGIMTQNDAERVIKDIYALREKRILRQQMIKGNK